MLNVIRTCPSRVKYCGRTVDNLVASNGAEYHPTLIVSSGKTPNENGLQAIREGVKMSDGKPFVFLEDDLAFIANFNRSANLFTRDCDGLDQLFLPLCAPCPKEMKMARGLAWRYPQRVFYGSQALVIYPDKVEDLLKFAYGEVPVAKRGFDMLLSRWAKARGVTHFFTPQRCFVQHVGVESSLHNGRFHHYSMWPGPDWTYRSGAFSMKEQKVRPFEKGLSKAIADWFGKALLAYDLGCSSGRYLSALIEHGLNAQGFDATPGIARSSPPIEELDLARPQVFTEAPGNVMCLEVAEHIHPQDQVHFLANLKALCADKLVLSWAVPGQGGKRHVNEQPRQNVINQIEALGFKYNVELMTKLSTVASIEWFKTSMYAFQKA